MIGATSGGGLCVMEVLGVEGGLGGAGWVGRLKRFLKNFPTFPFPLDGASRFSILALPYLACPCAADCAANEKHSTANTVVRTLKDDWLEKRSTDFAAGIRKGCGLFFKKSESGILSMKPD
ncbi:MAG: hypothetical protein IT576_00255 [Verrucomicrobiales bacterium]|nr:hypothetical protein [Verrucomicrobiales bacterium]